MSKQIYVNLPVADLAASTAFYEKLGFTKNQLFSDDNASCVVWSEQIIVMLLKHEFYKRFIRDKHIIDGTSTSGVLLAINLDSKEAVRQFADTAKANGGDVYQVDMGMPEDQMYGFEVEDLDGNHWEPVWMSPDFDPQATEGD